MSQKAWMAAAAGGLGIPLLLSLWGAGCGKGGTVCPPRPGPATYFAPEDISTAVGSARLLVVTETYFTTLGTRLDNLAGRVSLRTWPEMTEVPVTLDPKDWDGVSSGPNGGTIVPRANIELFPLSALDDRWYFIQVGSLPAGFRTSEIDPPHRLSDGSFGSRFRIGSEPWIRNIDFCDKDGKRFIFIKFSETVESEVNPAEVIDIMISGSRQAGASPYWLTDPGSDTVELHCPPFNASANAGIVVNPGLFSRTGVPVVQEGETLNYSFVIANLPAIDDACKRFFANP